MRDFTSHLTPDDRLVKVRHSKISVYDLENISSNRVRKYFNINTSFDCNWTLNMFRVFWWKISNCVSDLTSHLPRSQLTLGDFSLQVRIISLHIIPSFHHYTTGGMTHSCSIWGWERHQLVSGGCQSSISTDSNSNSVWLLPLKMRLRGVILCCCVRCWCCHYISLSLQYYCSHYNCPACAWSSYSGLTSVCVSVARCPPVLSGTQPARVNTTFMGRKLAGAAPRLPAPPLTTDAADVSLGGERSSWAGGAALLRRIREGGSLYRQAGQMVSWARQQRDRVS